MCDVRDSQPASPTLGRMCRYECNYVDTIKRLTRSLRFCFCLVADMVWCWRDVGAMCSDVHWCDVMWCAVMWCDAMWCDVMWWFVVWCGVVMWYMMWWRDVMRCDDAIRCDEMWWRDVMWYVMWCVMWWCDVMMWCDDVMWGGVMRCDMWCDVMIWWCDVMMWCDDVMWHLAGRARPLVTSQRWQRKFKTCPNPLKIGGRSPMVPSVMHAKFGTDSQRNKKVLGTPVIPRAGTRWPWAGREPRWRAPPHRPLVPGALLAEN